MHKQRFIAAQPGTAHDEYRTSDMNLAAFLLTIGRRLQGLAPENNGRRFFVFDGGAAQEVCGYYSGAAKVTARDFAAAIRNLKTLVHQG